MFICFSLTYDFCILKEFLGNSDGSKVTVQFDEIEGSCFRIYADVEESCRVDFGLLLVEKGNNDNNNLDFILPNLLFL